MEPSSFASGSRRSCVATAVVNALGAVDLIAAVVAAEHQRGVAESVQQVLTATEGLMVLTLQPTGGAWPREAQRGAVAAPEKLPRRVLFWPGVDALIREDPRHFERAVVELCALLTSPPFPQSGSAAIHRAVLIGGAPLLERMEHLMRYAGDPLRFRYILVE